MPAQIFSVINFKGGVGKTTTAVNLSASLAKLGKRVLLIDVDAQMSASGILLESCESIIKSNRTFPNMLATHLAGKKIQNKKWIQNITPSHTDTKNSHFDLIAGDHRTEKLETGLFKRPYVISKMVIALFADDYDFILFDCPPNLNRLTLNALTASDYYIVPTIPDFISMRGIKTLFEKMNNYFKRLTAKHHKNPELIGILLNRISYQRRNIQDKIKKDIFHNIETGEFLVPEKKKKYKYIFKQQISDRIDIPRSAEMRKSLQDYDPESIAAKEFIEFAKELQQCIVTLQTIDSD